MGDRLQGSDSVDIPSEPESTLLRERASHCKNSREVRYKREASGNKSEQQGHAIPRFVRSFHRRRYWTAEIESLLLATIIILVTITVLNANNGRGVWTRPITLNALLSLLITLFYMSVMFPVSSCILQLKWNHFTSSRRLYDLHLYDAATRSTWAAVRIMSSQAQSPLIFIAGFLVIAHTAIGPLTQQILLTSTVKLPVSGSALIPVVRGLSSSQVNAWEYLQGAPALLAGVFADQTSSFNVTPVCSAADCEWQGYATIMIRSESSDLSDGLSYPNDKTLSDALGLINWSLSESGVAGPSLPEMPVVTTADGQVMMHLTDMLNVLGEMKNFIRHPIGVPSGIPGVIPPPKRSTGDYKFSLLVADAGYNANASGCSNATTVIVTYQEATAVYETSDNDSDGKWSSLSFGKGAAWRATFDIVVQAMQATMIDWTFDEEKTAETKCFQDDNVSNNGTMILTSQGKDFLLDPYSPLHLEWGLNQLFQGQVYSYLVTGMTNPKVSIKQQDSNGSFDLSSAASALFQFATVETNSNRDRNGSSGSGMPLHTVQDVFSNVAQSLSKTLRATSGHTAQGTSVTDTTVYKIDWPWVSIPVALLVLTAGLLAAVIYDTRKKRLPVWTDSSMASLVHGIDGSTRRELAAFEQTEELDAACKRLKVRLGGQYRMLGCSENQTLMSELDGSALSFGS